MAERVGFEPTVEFPLHTLSKRAPSTTRTSLRLESAICGRSGSDYRKTLLQILLFCDAICIQRFTDGADSIVMEIVSDLLMSFDHYGVRELVGLSSQTRRWNRSSRCAEWRCEGERAPDEGEAKVFRQLERPNGANGRVIRHR